MKTRIIPSWLAPIITGALNLYLPALLGLMKSPSLKAAVEAVFNRVKNIIAAISDSNPENAEQVEAEVRKFISEDAVPLADGVIDEKIAMIKNDRVRLGLSLLADPVVDFARIAVDDNPDNAQQAEEIFDNFVLNPALQEYLMTELLTPLLENRIKDPILLAFVLQALSTGIAEGAEELAEIDIFDTARVVETLETARIRALDRSKATVVESTRAA